MYVNRFADRAIGFDGGGGLDRARLAALLGPEQQNDGPIDVIVRIDPADAGARTLSIAQPGGYVAFNPDVLDAPMLELRCAAATTRLPALRAILLARAIATGGIPFHASAVAVEGRGCILTGPSGAAKTGAMLAAIDDGGTALCAEHVVLSGSPPSVPPSPEPVFVRGWHLRQLRRADALPSPRRRRALAAADRLAGALRLLPGVGALAGRAARVSIPIGVGRLGHADARVPAAALVVLDRAAVDHMALRRLPEDEARSRAVELMREELAALRSATVAAVPPQTAEDVVAALLDRYDASLRSLLKRLPAFEIRHGPAPTFRDLASAVADVMAGRVAA